MPNWLLSWGGDIIAAIISIIAMFIGWFVNRKLKNAEKRFADTQNHIIELEKKLTILSAGRDAVITGERGQVVSGDNSIIIGGSAGDIKNY